MSVLSKEFTKRWVLADEKNAEQHGLENFKLSQGPKDNEYALVTV